MAGSIALAATIAMGSVAGTSKGIADSPITAAVVIDVATKTNRIQISFEKARLVTGGPSCFIDSQSSNQLLTPRLIPPIPNRIDNRLNRCAANRLPSVLGIGIKWDHHVMGFRCQTRNFILYGAQKCRLSVLPWSTHCT
jgi:hypothetical protein